MRCSFCYKKTNEDHLIEFTKNRPICWNCLDIIQKWEAYTYERKEKLNERMDKQL